MLSSKVTTGAIYCDTMRHTQSAIQSERCNAKVRRSGCGILRRLSTLAALVCNAAQLSKRKGDRGRSSSPVSADLWVHKQKPHKAASQAEAPTAERQQEGNHPLGLQPGLG